MSHYSTFFLTYLLAAAFSLSLTAAASLDIGSPTPPGSSSELSPGSWQVNASGTDIWSSSDSFHYYSFERSTDITVTAFVEDWENNHDWAKGGIMIRDTLEASSANAALVVAGNNYVLHQYRRWDGDWTRSHNEDVGTERVWLRLVKEGSKITSYIKSENEVNWIKFYERSDVIFGGSSFHVGVAATSHRQGELASLTVRGFEILNKIWVPGQFIVIIISCHSLRNGSDDERLLTCNCSLFQSYSILKFQSRRRISTSAVPSPAGTP